MATVVRRYSLVGPSNLDLSRFPGHSAAQSAVYPASSIDIQIDDAAPGTTAMLDEYMKSIGWVYSPGAAPQVGLLAAVNVWTKQQYSSPVALTWGANVAIDASLSNLFTLTLGGATAQLDNPTNLVAGMTFVVIVTQNAGGQNLTYGTNYTFGSEGAPNLATSGAGVFDILTFVAKSSTRIAGTVLRGFTP